MCVYICIYICVYVYVCRKQWRESDREVYQRCTAVDNIYVTCRCLYTYTYVCVHSEGRTKTRKRCTNVATRLALSIIPRHM